MKSFGALARMRDVSRVLGKGGLVRFTHKDGRAILVAADGESFQQIDGRTYDSFLRTWARKLHRTEYGSIAGGDLVFEWRRK